MDIIDRCLGLYRGDAYFVPRPVPLEMSDYWCQKADPDGRVRDLESERQARMEDVRYIAERVNKMPAGRILDAGCGLGELLEQIDPKHETFGVDESARSIESCRSRTSATLEIASLESGLPFEGSFAAVIAHHVIEHLNDPVRFVEEVHRRLTPDGLFVCGTPDFASAAARRYGDRYRLLHDRTHVSLFIEDSLLRLLRDKGFFIDEVEKPYFDSRFATEESFRRMASPDDRPSPAFYGSFMTVFARRL